MSREKDDTKSKSKPKEYDVLSHDLLIFMQHLETKFTTIEEESEEKNIIKEWLHLIMDKPDEDDAAARVRNMALSQLLMDMENNKLLYPFNERPSLRSYAELIDWLKTCLKKNVATENEDQCEYDVNKEPENRELDLVDYESLMSTDNRTYIAIQTLPKDGGLFGYVAVSMGDPDETYWMNSNGQRIPTLVPSNLPVTEVEVRKPTLKAPYAKRVWYVLSQRKPFCARKDSYEFYKVLYETVLQEMLDEECLGKQCTHPFINKLLEYLEIDMKKHGTNDHKVYCRFKMLSILKDIIRTILNKIETRSQTLEIAMKVSTISPVIQLPPKCCYDFVSSVLWYEISQQKPGNKYISILQTEYPHYVLPKYFAVLAQEKKNILTNISNKYCKILNQMFEDLGNSIMANMRKYKDAKWEWHLAHEIFEAYNKERAFKDSLCATENTADETTDSFLTVISVEMEMAQRKLKASLKKNDRLTQQLPEIRNEISDRKQTYRAIVIEHEEKIEKYKNEISNEKSDLLKRENTISELQRKAEELEKKCL